LWRVIFSFSAAHFERTMNELMLIVSTISSVLASAAALAGELRARRRRGDRVVSDAHERLNTYQPVHNLDFFRAGNPSIRPEAMMVAIGRREGGPRRRRTIALS
jgi:hypothetical protein